MKSKFINDGICVYLCKQGIIYS